MSNLWIFGDSFSTDFDINHAHQNHIDYMNYKGVNTMTHWPSLLANKLNYNLQNYAKGGNSNYQIFFDLCNNASQFEENDIVLVGWGLLGKFIIANKNQFDNIHPNDFNFQRPINGDAINEIIKNRKNEIWINEVISWEKLIYELIKLKNCKIIFWSGEESKLNSADIDLTKCATMTSETNELVQDSHLGIDGHNTLAAIFHNKL